LPGAGSSFAALLRPAAASDGIGSQAAGNRVVALRFSKTCQEELAGLLGRADAASPACAATCTRCTDRQRSRAGNSADALTVADRLKREAATPAENALLATSLLVRSTVERLAGDAARANGFAKQARELLHGASDAYLEYWAAMSIGVTARNRGHLEESLGALQEALSLAEQQETSTGVRRRSISCRRCT
jgi:hypothetical protein